MKNRAISLLLVITILLSSVGCGKAVVAERSILAETVDGTVEAVTDSSRYNVVTGEKLESGRYIKVLEESSITMLLDSDKHILAGTDSLLYLSAEGKTDSTRTRIELLKGLLYCSIDRKLKDGEYFEVATGNAVLAVRGTTFTVTITKLRSGEIYTTVFVNDGAVEVTTIEDGEKKTVTVPAGEYSEFRGEAPEKIEHGAEAIGEVLFPEKSEDNNAADNTEAEDEEADFEDPVYDNEKFRRNGPEVDARFEHYAELGGVITTTMDPYIGEPLVYRALKATIYETYRYFPEEMKPYMGKETYGPHIYVIEFSEPVTMTDGSTYKWMELAIDGNYYSKAEFGEFPMEVEFEVFGFFDMRDNGPAFVDGQENLNNKFFGEHTWSFGLHDYRW